MSSNRSVITHNIINIILILMILLLNHHKNAYDALQWNDERNVVCVPTTVVGMYVYTEIIILIILII